MITKESKQNGCVSGPCFCPTDLQDVPWYQVCCVGSLGCCIFSSWCSCSCRIVPCVISTSKQEASRSPTFVLKKVSRRAAPVQNLQDVQHCDLCCNLLRFAENTACFGGLTCPDQQLISETFVLSRCISKHRANLNQSSFTKHASTRALCTLRLWYWC